MKNYKCQMQNIRKTAVSKIFKNGSRYNIKLELPKYLMKIGLNIMYLGFYPENSPKNG